MRRISVPIDLDTVRSLTVGEPILLNGVLVTGRDAAHKYMIDSFVKTGGIAPESEVVTYEALKRVLRDGVIYHCGPVVRQEGERYSFVAAGPTTSIREEPYQSDVIEHFGVRGVIGKGGMGAKTRNACEKHGAVYLHAIGGAASILAKTVKEVLAVYKLEFGVPEAFWVIRVEDFPVVVTIDAHGNSLHDTVLEKSSEKLGQLI
jgi:fumarate hydratase subunit beta